MNDQTPRRYKGTLLERAAAQFHYGAPQVPQQPQQQIPAEPAQPRMAPAAPAYPLDGLELPRLRRGHPLDGPAFAPAAPVAPEVLAVPEVPPVPEAPAPRPGRRIAPVDRTLLAQQGMIVPGSHVTTLAEEFRLVKRQLLLTARAVAGEDAMRSRMILVCSAQPDEGKTFCAINLALSMAAEKDVEILLVDADFAKPDVLQRLGIPAGPGLLDALSGAVAHVEDCIIDTDIPQLSLLPAGTRTASDTELLASDRARAILDGLAAANPRRIVIFDSPPALAASPASVLALHAGQVMLVVRADKTTESDLREATAMLDACEHIQLLLNGVSFQPGGRRFGSYYGEAGK
ncbi:AAA family ATPase [Sphingomonas canadensis]|uniref:AAA family ATPase n=1 Tax=Sphingomonas canadensis TaxID=1219257 RepID=A0ABW3H3E2_9SPHN|nr:AAA family ATPase [Sphingomonas canadensis]MCW3835563.1 AAA family ATPase [Sphingomonas canadensis]